MPFSLVLVKLAVDGFTGAIVENVTADRRLAVNRGMKPLRCSPRNLKHCRQSIPFN